QGGNWSTNQLVSEAENRGSQTGARTDPCEEEIGGGIPNPRLNRHHLSLFSRLAHDVAYKNLETVWKQVKHSSLSTLPSGFGVEPGSAGVGCHPRPALPLPR